MEKTSHISATITPLNQLGRVPVRLVTDPARHAAPYLLTLHVGGKRKRTFHATEDDAVKAWKEHKRLEKKFGALPYLFDAEAQRSYDTAIRLLAGRASIEDAIRFYLAHCPARTAPALDTAITDFIANKTRLARSSRHVADLKSRLESFARALPATVATVFDVRSAHVAAYCLAPDIAARTARNRHSGLSNFFAWCVRQEWITDDPTARLRDTDLPTASKTAKIILTPAQACALFDHAGRLIPECLPWLAVQAFAGIRDAEAGRLTDAMIDRSGRRLRIPAAICKTSDDWVITGLHANLWTWLPKGCAFVEPHHRRWRRVLDALAALPETDPGRVPAWPFNALRRSFCTYDITQNGDAIATASRLRHSSPARLYSSYLGALRTKAEARAYFSITPATP